MPDPNYFRTSTDSGSPPQRTDQGADESVGEHLLRHLDELKIKMGQGWVLGFEACVRWNIATNPYYFDSCLSRSPVTETDAHFLDRLFTQAATDVAAHPPS